MEHKRITLFAGHYGSGKTNIAVNYALHLRETGLPVRIADLDIVNPYFRTMDSAQRLSEAGIELMPVERANKKLWHAMAGAAYVKFVMGIDDREIIRAVRYHTTGRAGMSLLEKIVYLADYISAERNYSGVENMRKLCEKDMDEAIEYALVFGIPDLVTKGQVIHPDSIDLYNEVIMKKQGGNSL